MLNLKVNYPQYGFSTWQFLSSNVTVETSLFDNDNDLLINKSKVE